MSVRKILPSEYKRAAETLAEAFEDDPVMSYMTPIQETKLKESRKQRIRVFQTFVEYLSQYGECYTSSDDFECVALWIPPGVPTNPSLFKVLWTGTWKLLFQLSFKSLRRYIQYSDHSDLEKSRNLGDRKSNFWYLAFIGTRNDGRGKGHSRKLMDHITNIADKDNIPCYLESSKLHNTLYIYSRMGYVECSQIHLKDGIDSADIWCMIREPNAESDLKIAPKKNINNNNNINTNNSIKPAETNKIINNNNIVNK